MENLIKKQAISLSRYILDGREECAVSGDFSLPDYCPDIAVVLKCVMTPCVQNRQWSGGQLLVDALVGVRVIYLDEEHRTPRTVEFGIPFSCAMRCGGDQLDTAMATLKLFTKYANCRAVGPRRIEVRGAVILEAKAEGAYQEEISVTKSVGGLYTQCCSMEATYPFGKAEKVLTINESLEFPETMPAAEILLGGECRVIVKECKLLSGKGIVKGQIYVHQLYASDWEAGECHCLDFIIPFSQILDIEEAREGMAYQANALLLSDMERCAVGPDGENTVLDITMKVLVQLQVYQRMNTELLVDAYHTACPVLTDTKEVSVREHCGCRWEDTVLPMKISLPAGHLTHIMDVWVQNQECNVSCRSGVAVLRGRWFVCILARDVDGQVTYLEQPEEYCLEFPVMGNSADALVTVTEIHYRVVDDQLELQVGVNVALNEACLSTIKVVKNLHMQTDHPYPAQREGALIYYAHAGERVWDIGARCHTSPDCIVEENNLQCDVLDQSTVLLVPIIH